ncbi:MAG: (2Fe-2S) ferredoxin domain-containing protein [Bacillota bacterium]
MKTIQELEKIRRDALEEIRLREEGEKIRVVVGLGTCGIAAGAREIMNALTEEIARQNVDAVVTPTGCIGFCIQEPLIEVHIPGMKKVTYGNVTVDMAKEIVEKHLVGRTILSQWVIHE